MTKELKEKFKEQEKLAKKNFKKQIDELKERQKDARDAKRKLAMVERKIARVKFIEAQKKCFKRLFKVTVGMMCMTCNANWEQFFDVDTNTMIMNKRVCTNLMKDCFPYLAAQELQGRQMLDMRRMKKFQMNKKAIVAKLTILKDRIANATEETQDQIIEDLNAYQQKIKDAMVLKKADFTGEGAEDLKYGFKMPRTCENETRCNWICQNMIKHDGISNKTMNSDQNLQETDLTEDQQFETDLVIVDDSDDDEIVDDNDNTNTTARRMLEATAEPSLLFDETEGFVADDDAFESAEISVEDDWMSEEVVVPEDKIDPETGDVTDDSSSSGISMWVWIVGGVALLAIIGGAIYAYQRSKEDQFVGDDMQMTQVA